MLVLNSLSSKGIIGTSLPAGTLNTLNKRISVLSATVDYNTKASNKHLLSLESSQILTQSQGGGAVHSSPDLDNIRQALLKLNKRVKDMYAENSPETVSFPGTTLEDPEDTAAWITSNMNGNFVGYFMDTHFIFEHPCQRKL